MEGEEKDHQHHRSLWFSHGAVNGVDFWAETPKAGKIQHDQFLELKSGKDEGFIKSTSKWVAPDGKVVCTDERIFRVYNRPANERLFDFEITIKAPADRDVLFGDTKEGTMAVRVNESMRVTQAKTATGHIVKSTGVRDDAPVAKGQQDLGQARRVVRLLRNRSTASRWASRSLIIRPIPCIRLTGTCATTVCSPRILLAFMTLKRKPAGTGNLNIPAGQSVTFKYRFYIHEGDEKKAKVAERYKEYVSEKK